jgi:hypothetical protein
MLLVASAPWLLPLTLSLGASTWTAIGGGRPARRSQSSFASSQSYSTILAGFPQRILRQVRERQVHYNTVDSLPSGAVSKLPKSAGSNEVRRSVEAQSGDACGLRSWVVARHLVRSLQRLDILLLICSDAQNTLVWGRISNIAPTSSSASQENTISLDVFDVGARLHPKFDMPVLRKRTGAPVTIPSKVISHSTLLISCSFTWQNIEFLASVQHDCHSKKCKGTGSRTARQERVSSGRNVQFIEHVEDEHFVVNMHAMHNAHRIRRVLPRELIQPRHLYQDRTARHHAIAATLHVQMVKKRAETAAKTKATKAKNAADRAEGTARATKRPRVEDSDLELDEVDKGDEDAMDIV